jgi:hypothetical protein
VQSDEMLPLLFQQSHDYDSWMLPNFPNQEIPMVYELHFPMIAWMMQQQYHLQYFQKVPKPTTSHSAVEYWMMGQRIVEWREMRDVILKHWVQNVVVDGKNQEP